MDAPHSTTSPKEVELTGETDTTPKTNINTQERLIVDVEIKFWTHVGWDGVLVMLFSLGIVGLFVYITFLYTKAFHAWHRPGVWVFVVLAVLHALSTFIYILTWKKIARSSLKAKESNTSLSFIGKFRKFKSLFKINGDFFLWKLYMFEFIESINQMLNVFTVYLCTLPVEVTSSICACLSIDALYRAYLLRQPPSIARRDRQVEIDIFVDFLYVAVPLCALWFGFQSPISIQEMTQITVWPTLCLLSKLRSIFREIVRFRAENKLFKRASRSTERIFLRSRSSADIINKQQGRMPTVVSTAFFVYSLLYGLFFLVVAVAHVAMQPTGCDEITWSKGCVVKVPFCKSLFTPTCNCASLKVEKDYKLVALPNSLVDEMTGLRIVFIRHCNLTKLPPRMEQLTEMVEFEISSNRLEEFMVDVGKWEKLNLLVLTYNKLKRLPAAVWTHSSLAYLDFSDNIGLKMPAAEKQMSMPSLLYFGCRNNSVTIHLPFNNQRFPNLLDLFVNGNRLTEFPDTSLKESLQYLGVARCHLKQLPSFLAEFSLLIYLDARDNNISTVGDNVKMIIKKNRVESYFSGNPACKTDSTLDCQHVCSQYCGTNKLLGNGVCEEECNSEGCKYDGGDCL